MNSVSHMCKLLLVGLLLVVTCGVLMAEPAAVTLQIRSDWDRQEKAAGRWPGSPESINAAITRGRALAVEMTEKGHNAQAAECLESLMQFQEQLIQIEKRKKSQTSIEIFSPDGWHLVRAAVCGAGTPLDQGRVQGKDYTYRGLLKNVMDGSPSKLKTVSFAAEKVIYRFDELDPNAKYRLRAIYGVDRMRKLRTTADGHLIHEVSVADGTIIAKTDAIPTEAVADGSIELVIESVSGANSIISGLELWSNIAEMDKKKNDRLMACRKLTSLGGPDYISYKNRDIYYRVRRAIRKLMFSDPALDFDELLFIKRNWPTGDHQCAHRVGEHQTPGASLCVLKGLAPDGQVRTVYSTDKGGIGRYDLSFDAKRIVFPFAVPRKKPTAYRWGGGHSSYDPANPADSTAYRGGACEMYDIYEIGVDGKGLRQLTDNITSEDTEPCYLADGRIAFTSSRDNRLVQCGDWALVFGLHTINGDGSGVRALTQPQDSEFYPSMLAGGQILFTRWDYVMKSYNVIQQLWVTNPDGTRTQLAYGDWFEFSNGPIAMFEARQIPGTSKVVAVGAAHHNTAVGPLMIADLNKNRQGSDGMTNITPEVGYPEILDTVTDERVVKGKPEIPGMSHYANYAGTGWYASPWPVSETLFLTCYSFEIPGNARTGYGIYLYDVYGNKELVYRDKDISCYSPRPLKARPKPFNIPPAPRPEDRKAPGKLIVQDIYAGLEGVAPGTVKWIRVCETYPKKRHTNPHRVDVGVASGWDMRGVLGVVPVEEDGSAYFDVPSNKMIFLEALDKDFLEVQRMRNYLTLQAGEVQTCVGCHESPTTTPTFKRPLATRKAASLIASPPWGAGPMRFAKVVQPVLDRNCIGCHDGSKQKDKAFDLRGGRRVTAPHAGDFDEGPQHSVSTSFLSLLPHVKYLKFTGHSGLKLPLKPYAVGSAVSPLMHMLKKGHHKVELTQADWRALAAWIDCNAPYFGSYDDTMR